MAAVRLRPQQRVASPPDDTWGSVVMARPTVQKKRRRRPRKKRKKKFKPMTRDDKNSILGVSLAAVKKGGLVEAYKQRYKAADEIIEADMHRTAQRALADGEKLEGDDDDGGGEGDDDKETEEERKRKSKKGATSKSLRLSAFRYAQPVIVLYQTENAPHFVSQPWVLDSHFRVECARLCILLTGKTTSTKCGACCTWWGPTCSTSA